MGCFKCLGSLLCVAVLAAAGIVAWLYGPWSKENTETAQGNFQALNTCDTCCNGLESNCELRLDEVTFPMVHNGHSSKADQFIVGYNNNKGLEDALVAGYRGLMLDSCICDESLGETINNLWQAERPEENGLGFCHKSCDAGVRNPSKVMGNIKKFLDVNRNEVLIIEFQINDNSLEQLYKSIDESGIDKYIYRTEIETNEWPTMQSLIDSDTRLILFAHGDPMESCKKWECPQGIHYTYDHFQQTNWNDSTCDVKGNAPRQGTGFFLMNHWLNNEADLPSPTNAEQFNSYSALTTRINLCENGAPNIIAVDFWSVGDVLDVVKEMNTKKV